MECVTVNAEAELAKQAIEVAGRGGSWSGVFIDNMQLPVVERGKTLLREKILVDLLAGQEGYLFILQNSDIFLLMKGVQRQAIKDVCFKMLAVFSAVDEQKSLRIFDLSAPERNDFIKLCNQKLAAALENASAKPEVKKTAALSLEANKALIPTIGQRRNIARTPKILIIEDDKFSQKLVRNLLAKQFDIFTADDGQAGIDEFIIQAPDIVLLDINLPGVSGIEVLKLLLQIDKSVFVIMLSGNSTADNVMTAVKLGAKGFIGKPFSAQKLQDYINTCTSIKHKHKGDI